MRTLSSLLLLALSLTVLGCAGTGGERVSNVLRESIGTYSPTNIKQDVPQIMTQRFNYEFERVYDTDQELYYETRWLSRVAAEDEAALGAEMTRHRFLIDARPSNRSAETLITYRVTVRAEREARMIGKASWEPIPITAMAREEMQQVINELKMRLESGIQVR